MAGRKKPTNLSLDAALVAEAGEYDVNLSQAAEAGVREAVRAAKADAWKRENLEAMLAYNKWIEENGIPFEEYRQF